MGPGRKYSPARKKSQTAPKNVTRQQIEAKLNELDRSLSEASSQTMNKAKVALGVVVVIGLGVAFFAGRRRALRPKTVVSFIKTR